MSAIRYFDVPHIVRYGHTDDEKCTTWMRFYRNATCFEVSANQADIAGTSFEEQWREYLAPPPKDGPPGAWVHRWESFCDLVISQILPKLKELAPTGGRSWTTFKDYLCTPTYCLSIHKSEGDSEQSNVVAIVDSGPLPAPAFAYKPQPMTDLDLPTDLPIYQASELKLLQDKNLRLEPSKIVMPDGTFAFLVPAKKSMRRMPEDVVIHPSMTAINSHISFHRLLITSDVSRERLGCLPNILGVVTTSATSKESVTETETGTQSPSTTLLAGILLTYLPHARSLSDPSVISAIAKSSNPDTLRQKWHKTLLEAMQTLHATSDIVHGNINPHTIMMYRDAQGSNDSNDDPDTLRPCLKHISQELSNHLFIDKANRGTKEADLQGLENTFGDNGWLAYEIKQMNGEVDQNSRWEKAGG